MQQVIAVGAIFPCGERKRKENDSVNVSCDNEDWGSCYSYDLNIMAPGVLLSTIDRQGNERYNPNSRIQPNIVDTFSPKIDTAIRKGSLYFKSINPVFRRQLMSNFLLFAVFAGFVGCLL